MEPFLIRGHEGKRSTAIDWDSPDELMMQAEIEAGIDTEGQAVDTLALRKIPPDALKILLRYLLPAGRKGPARWSGAVLKLAVLSNAADVDDLGGMTFTDIAKELGVSRALVSLYSLKLVDELGINKVRAGKSRESREVFRQSALAAHKRAGHREGLTQERRAFSE